ncbi:hypothetical protein O181_127648, partial [Austropuccinia psidii MF-1]|nr:hypothetical protein [Austropuccinia psidii MF-1]
SFSFPLTLTTDFITQPKNQGATLQGDLAHGYNRFLAFPLHQSLVHTEINTTQHSNGKLEFNATGTVMSGVARTSQKFDYQDSRGNTFGRDVEIFNNTNIIRDVRSGTLSKLVPQEVVKPSHTVVYTMEDNLKDYKDQDIGRNSHLFDIKRLGVGN